MPLQLSDVKRQIQDHLQEGLLLVVGTGVSIAEGIPGMGALASHLKAEIPATFTLSPDPGWQQVVAALDAGDHLEAAMGKATLQQATVDAIVAKTADLIRRHEEVVFERVLRDNKTLPFTVFVRHLFKAARQINLITPNYDRLVEFATEAAGIGLNSRIFGYLHGIPAPKRSADAHRESYYLGKNAAFRSTPCLCVHKPHGSLDWYEVNGQVVRCPTKIGKPPLIITPGSSKYRQSFQRAFDDQRAAGNRAATIATRLMFLGYGFNDDHLEQYLCPGLRLSKPSIIVTRDLSANARTIIRNSAQTAILALSAAPGADHKTVVTSSSGEELVIDEVLWNLDAFNKGVL